LGHASQKANRDDEAQDQLSRSDIRHDESRDYEPTVSSMAEAPVSQGFA